MRVTVVAAVAVLIVAIGGCPLSEPSPGTATLSQNGDAPIGGDNQNASAGSAGSADNGGSSNSDANENATNGNDDGSENANSPQSPTIDLVTLSDWKLWYLDSGITDCVSIENGVILAYFPDCSNRSLGTSHESLQPNGDKDWIFHVTVATVGELAIEVREQSDGTLMGSAKRDGESVGPVIMSRK